MNRIVLFRILPKEENETIETISGVLLNNGVGYPIITFERNNNAVTTFGLEHFELTDQGITRAIDLPPLKQFLARWDELLEELSKRFPDTLVTILVDGVIEVALNGTIL